MTGRRERPDSRLRVARYRVDGEIAVSPPDDEPETARAGQRSMDARAQFIEVSIQQAMRRGDFDDLAGAGKPLTGLTAVHDPDWWIRRKIEREKLTGLGPPALTLRTEDAQLDEALDATGSEQRVREIIDDFNRRVIEARRQLQGGPPVVTATRDVDAELERWAERRRERLRARAAERERQDAGVAALTWRQRWARRRPR
jgi:hypothetical protein